MNKIFSVIIILIFIFTTAIPVLASPKESPKEQFEYAESFKDKKPKKCLAEHKKLLKFYKNSSFAEKSQLRIAQYYYDQHQYFTAAKEYQKAIDGYHSPDKLEMITNIQKRIANYFFANPTVHKNKKRYEKAAIVYSMAIKNMPFSKNADEFQYRIGLCYQREGKLEEAAKEFRKLISNYPNSVWVDDAYYWIAICSITPSNSSSYDQSSTDATMDKLTKFTESFPNSNLCSLAERKIRELQDIKAQKDYEIAEFYNKQNNKGAAEIYYKRVLKTYSFSKWTVLAEKKLKEIQTKGGKNE
ncbi:MAG: outer membrane protein assembly factor BamD [bacterium]|nr:outer membrane protein assembly factor BamD [bacterium]